MVRADVELIRVPKDYPTIQEAINVASSGSLILVSSATYHEHLVVNKTLRIIGVHKTDTILDGARNGNLITVTADNVFIDGFTIQNGSTGIFIDHSINATISGNIIMQNQDSGITLEHSNGSIISSNIILSNGDGYPGGIVWGEGIILVCSNNNTVSDNTIASNIISCICLTDSNNNLVQRNAIENNYEGITLLSSNTSIIHHNNFVNNAHHVKIGELDHSYGNVWDDTTEGNYWDDYTGLDDGSDDRVAGDGVGDTDLPHQGVDNYPLVQPPTPIPILWENSAYPVAVASNSTVSAFRFIQPDKKITFNVRGPSNTTGYFRLDIPKALLSDNPWKILLNNIDATPQAVIIQNQTHTSIFCTYNRDSSYEVQIIGTRVIPEFSAENMLGLLVSFMASMLAAILNKRKSARRSSAVRKTLRSQDLSRQTSLGHQLVARNKGSVREN